VSSGLDVVNIARQEVGFQEGPNNKNKYGEWYGMDHEPYCAMFVSWCFAQAGLSSIVSASTSKGFSYCPAGIAWFQKQGEVVDKYKGQPGDIVFFSWGGHTAEHVGIIVAASKDGITTVEGNTSADHKVGSQANGDGVWLRHRPYLNIMAIVRPKYPTTSKPTSSLLQSKTIAGGVAGVTAIGGGGAAVLNNNSSTPKVKPTAISAPAFPGTKSFVIGAKNQAVFVIEQGLVKLKLLTLADSTFDSATETAVISYQKSNPSLGKADGIVGPITYAALVAEAKA
jgi:peptidoglycan hydrolase-like protein with peptidoglycan-binding domain